MTLRGTLNQRLSATPVMHIVAWNDNQSKDNCWFLRQNTQTLTTCIFFAILHAHLMQMLSYLMKISMAIFGQGETTKCPGR
jgi:hypothetical protein